MHLYLGKGNLHLTVFSWILIHFCYFLADLIVGITCIILIGLFSLQQFGTHRVAFAFAPIILIWLFCTSSIGIYNIFRWNPNIYKGLSPYYIFAFFHQTGEKGWISLGGVVLCITGKKFIKVIIIKMNCAIVIKMSKQWESHETRGAVLVDHHVPQDHNCIVGTCLNAHPCGNLCQAWFAALSSKTIMQFYFNRNVLKSLLHDSINFYNR